MNKGLHIQQAMMDAGADKAAVLHPDNIVLSREFREICQRNQCGKFERCWMCPPEIGAIESLMQRVRRYSGAVLYQTISPLSDSFDIEGMLHAAQSHAALSNRIQQRLIAMQIGDSLHLTCGGCHLCPTCAKEQNVPCRFPKNALPSLEGYGVDVYRTTAGTDLKYLNGENTVTYFGMVLYQEGGHGKAHGL